MPRYGYSWKPVAFLVIAGGVVVAATMLLLRRMRFTILGRPVTPFWRRDSRVSPDAATEADPDLPRPER